MHIFPEPKFNAAPNNVQTIRNMEDGDIFKFTTFHGDSVYMVVKDGAIVDCVKLSAPNPNIPGQTARRGAKFGANHFENGTVTPCPNAALILDSN